MLVVPLLLSAAVASAQEAATYRVSGLVVDTFGNPTPDATVLIEELGLELTTDADGTWSTVVPQGTYTFKFFAEGTSLTRIAGVAIDGPVIALDAVVKPAPSEELTIVEADRDRSRDDVLLEVRRNAATVQDSIGAESIARSTDKHAGDAVKRVPGISVVGERYVYVRGMGERYNTTTLNGQTIPSPEPKKRVVPFNILPSNLLRDITIVKTPTADMDGDTVGGRVELETKDYPEQFTLQATVSGGWNSLATFQDIGTTPGGATDWLGLDDGTRAEPEDASPTLEDLLNLSNEELSGFVSKWNNEVWTPDAFEAPPNHSFNIGVGGTAYPGTQKIGYVFALTYDRSYKFLDESVVFHTRIGDEGAYEYVPSNTLDQTTSTTNVLWGAIGNLSWRFHPSHEVKIKTVYTRRAENELRFYHEENDSQEIFEGTRLRWTEQSVFSGVLEGEHDLDVLSVEWDANYGLASMVEPDRREYIYSTANSSIPEDGSEIPLTWFDQSGFRFFNALSDDEKGGRVDVTVPFSVREPRDSKIKAGWKLRDKRRDFTSRYYAFDVSSSLEDDFRGQTPDVLFGEDSIAAGNVTVQDTSRPDDNYNGIFIVNAGYLMGDVTVLPWLRAVAGARVEATYQDFQTGGYVDDETTPDAFVIKEYTDILPSGTVTFKVSPQTNIRLATFRSIARPDYFELVPFRFTNYYKNVTQTGNPELDRTRVWNVDARVETFPAPESVFAATVFFKSLEDPIEVVYVSDPTQGQINLEKPYNVPTGVVVGGELEARDDLGRLVPALDGVFYGANLTLVHSQVNFDDAELGSEDAVIQVNDLQRPLAGQSPFVANLTLGYENEDVGFNAQGQLNVTGRRLATVGANGLPSGYEETYHTFDLAVQQSLGKHVALSLKGTNLTDPERIWQQEGKTSYSYRLGQSISLSVSGRL